MKRRILGLCFCFCLMACTKASIKEIDITELSQRFYETSAFDAEFIMQTDENAQKISGLTDFEIEEIILYADSGALSDKILLIHAEENTLMKIQEILKKENESLQKSYVSYNPEEVPKLEDAVLKIVHEDTLIYCISKDSELIEKVLNDYLNGK